MLNTFASSGIFRRLISTELIVDFVEANNWNYMSPSGPVYCRQLLTIGEMDLNDLK